MGRHSTAQAERKTTPLHRLWWRLPRDFRARVWERRQQWRAFWDRFYKPKGDWDKDLPDHPLVWVESMKLGAYAVGAAIRKTRRERGDLLPEHHQEQS